MGECVATLRIKDNGDFEIEPRDRKTCDRVLKKINPVRGIFWRNHLKQKKQKPQTPKSFEDTL